MKRLVCVVLWAAMGCGASETEPTASAPTSGGGSGTSSAGGEWRASASPEPEARDDGFAVEGLDGTISPQAVEAGVSSVLPAITDCFAARYDALEVLSGDFTLGFRIARDGRVASVKLLQSTVGDRETERCIVRAARTIRFAKPTGGEADASQSLGLDLPDDVRPPVAWPRERGARLVSANGGPSLKHRCGVESEVFVTAYVGRGGRPLAVGAAGDAEGTALDCVAKAVSAWKFPDPGSYPAKVSFSF
ncbi:MAG: AgmX/PglI C-terminal domain-containing protein [Myxococcales bacterium]|nr:AgmX/PglI C-terminal domain-containing protein [Myxococcales bacterium]